MILPLIFEIRFPEKATPMVEDVFREVEKLPAGSKVLIAFDYDPASEPELAPMATAWLRQCAIKGHKMYILALWPLGQQMAANTISEVFGKELKNLNLKYGVDYVNLGFKSGGQGVINVILGDFEQLYSTDTNGTSVHDIPMMKNVKNLKSMDLIVNISAGTPGLKEWVQFGSDPAGVPLVGGSTAVQAPLMYPYYPRQMVGMLGGLKGAAEYEQLVQEKYPQFRDPKLNVAIRRMGPQAVAHIVIMAFILIGNITFFIDKRRSRKR